MEQLLFISAYLPWVGHQIKRLIVGARPGAREAIASNNSVAQRNLSAEAARWVDGGRA